MLHAIIQGILGFLLELLFSFLWWIMLFPVVWLVSLPFILVIALFRREKYRFAVMDMLTSVHYFWKDWGILMVS